MQTTGGIQHNSKQKGTTNDRLNMQQGFQNGHRFPAYVFGKSKRIRNKNWELLEIQVLKKMIDNHYELLNSRHTNAMMNARKNLVWKRIADSINALGLHRRTIRELKIKWSNMRLTERRKSGNSAALGSDSGDGAILGNEPDHSLDIVDISQSSFEEDVDLNRSGEQENLMDKYGSAGAMQQVNEIQNNLPQSSSFRKRPSDDKWLQGHQNRQSDLDQMQISRNENEYPLPDIPFNGGMSNTSVATNSYGVPSQSSTNKMSPMAVQSSCDRMSTMSRPFHNSTKNQISTVSQNNENQRGCIQGRNSSVMEHSQSYIDQDVSSERLQPWPHENLELRNNNMEAAIVGRPRENVHDFSQDKIYMPGVVIKEEPEDCTGVDKNVSDLEISINVPERYNTSSQTDWRLSCVRDYPCPSLPVSEKDVTAIKYEILKLERSQLVLKNENIELQNSKLRLEISKMQSNL